MDEIRILVHERINADPITFEADAFQKHVDWTDALPQCNTLYLKSGRFKLYSVPAEGTRYATEKEKADYLKLKETSPFFKRI